MKLNIFAVPSDNVLAMEEKFKSVGLESIHVGEQSGWKTAFYFSKGEEPNPIPWVGTFAEFFGDTNFLNLIYFGAYVFKRDDHCFVLTYGKSHFYVRHFASMTSVLRSRSESQTRTTSSKPPQRNSPVRKRKKLRAIPATRPST